MPQGPGQDELTDSWDAVGEAKFYVIGRISQKSFLADKAEGQDWRDSITYRSAANNGQFAYTVDGLIPGETYRFIVGSSSGRYDKPQWSPWSGLVKLQLPCLGDRDALVALYNSTGGDRWQSRLNWITNEPTGAWFGVSTDSDGCVTVLYVDNNNLSGTLPPELGNLTRLETLDLDGNRIGGEIPAEIGNLTNLTVLSLDHNRNLVGEIPATLVDLTNLVLLYVERNALTGCIPAALYDVGENDLAKLGSPTCP